MSSIASPKLANSMNEDDFYLKVAHALSGCQLVEQELKLYITEALELAKKCIAGRMPFGMSGDDYADCSPERLITAFEKLTDNRELVRELAKFKKERNFLSHKGIAHCLDLEGGLFDPTAREFVERLEAIRRESRRLWTAIQEEANKFCGHLLFDVVSEEK